MTSTEIAEAVERASHNNGPKRVVQKTVLLLVNDGWKPPRRSRGTRFFEWAQRQGVGLRDAWVQMWDQTKPVLPYFLALLTVVFTFVLGGILTEVLNWRWL